MDFVGIVVDRQGIRPGDSKVAAVVHLPPPPTVEEPRAFRGMTGFLLQFVKLYSIIASPLTDILRNKAFASKRSRRSPIPWLEPQQQTFLSLKSSLTSFPILVFRVWGPSMGQYVCVAHRCQCGRHGCCANTGLRGGRAVSCIRQRSVVSTDGRRGATDLGPNFVGGRYA